MESKGGRVGFSVSGLGCYSPRGWPRLEAELLYALHIESDEKQGDGHRRGFLLEVQKEVVALLMRRFAERFGAASASIEGGQFVVRLSELNQGGVGDHATEELIRSVCMSLDGVKILSGRDQCIIGLSWRGQGAFGPSPEREGVGSLVRRSCRRDVTVAEAVFADVSSGAVRVCWQPVLGATGPREALFYRAALCRVDMRDGGLLPPDGIDGLRRLGTEHLLDQWMVGAVLDELQAAPYTVLVVEISAAGLRAGWWRHALVERLEGEFEVARRLILTIAGDAMTLSRADVIKSVDRLRAIGCQVAIEVAQATESVCEAVAKLGPEMVEVPTALLEWAARSPVARSTLDQLCSTLAALGASVLVKGVASERHVSLAGEIGADWLLGEYFGSPRASRSWVTLGSGSRSLPDLAGRRAPSRYGIGAAGAYLPAG